MVRALLLPMLLPLLAALPTGLPTGTDVDYQLGGAADVPDHVGIVVRDRTAAPAAGRYNVCYVNSFQAQPDETGTWRKNHPELLLHDEDGELVIDEDWDEVLFDISTPARRTALAKIVGEWIDGCAESGFQAVEADNLDSYTRSDGLLKKTDAVAFAKLLTTRAHAAGLAMGQKNSAELLAQHARVGFDFAVAEECARYDECDAYAEVYDDRVYVIEYRARDLTEACANWGGQLSIVLRDRDLRPSGEQGYVRRTC